jgi:membrane fusion protein, heavy metal efflux system
MCGRQAKTRLHRYSAFRTCELGATGNVEAGRQIAKLMIRTTIHNEDRALKAEMYAGVSIFTDEGDLWPAIPREAVIYEGNTARVWVAHDDRTIERRSITPGMIDGRMIQVLKGLRPGEKVVTKGSLFIDRAAAGT